VYKGSVWKKPITKEHMLANGLKVIVREDHRAPVVVSQVWYKVGSAKENRPITGISHALEHMMFQGTPTLPGDGFATLISQHGGVNNAFTAEDYTAYYEELDATNLAISFEAEADRMMNLTLSPEAYAKEIQVVIEERRMRTDDNPQNLTYERFMAHANPMGPYHHPVIGWQDDLNHLSVQDLRQWYQLWYAPNNATLVVVGDVNANDVFQLAEKYFAKVPAKTIPEIKADQELKSLGQKRVQVNLPAQLPYMIWGFDVPSLLTTKQESEAYALVVVDALLDSGESSRFNRDIIRGAQVASQLDTSYEPFKRFATQFFIAGIPAPGRTTVELEQKVMEQIQKLKTELVSAEELERTKTQLLAQQIYNRDSISQQAIFLGELESIGLSWQLADSFPDKIQAVTAEQVQQAVQKYFTPEKLTVGELIPEKINE